MTVKEAKQRLLEKEKTNQRARDSRAKEKADRLEKEKEEKSNLVAAGRKQGMCQGVALALAIYLRYHGTHPGIIEAWRACGMSIEECEQMEVDEYDLEIFREYENELNGSKYPDSQEDEVA